jgi:putative oxidoreductase
MKILSLLLRVTAAIILLQTLYFKFTGAEESIYIFSTVGAEPWGRYGSGVIELVASVLLLIPSTVTYGALLCSATGAGAILSHLAFLGIEVNGDGGLLFGLAVTILVCGLALLVIHRRAIPILGAALAA